MENCVIASLFPTRGQIAPHRSYSGEDPIDSLEVWQLEEPSNLDTFGSADNVRLEHEASWAKDIRYTECDINSRLYAVAFGSSDCKLDFVQAAPRFGKQSRSFDKSELTAMHRILTVPE